MKAKRKPKLFPDRLRAAVEQSGLSHYRIAKDAGCENTTVDRFMAGSDPKSALAERIANAAGYRIELVPLDED